MRKVIGSNGDMVLALHKAATSSDTLMMLATASALQLLVLANEARSRQSVKALVESQQTFKFDTSVASNNRILYFVVVFCFLDLFLKKKREMRNVVVFFCK